jgi:hypothetical protein
LNIQMNYWPHVLAASRISAATCVPVQFAPDTAYWGGRPHYIVSDEREVPRFNCATTREAYTTAARVRRERLRPFGRHQERL